MEDAKRSAKPFVPFVAEERLESFDGIKWQEGFASKVGVALGSGQYRER